MSTLLTELVRRQTSSSLLGLFSRVIDKVAEEMAHDLLQDPEFRARMQELVRVAFDEAMTELRAPAPPRDFR